MTGSAIPILSAFAWVPDFAKGRVRDLRVRWALEEVGQPYETVLLNAMLPRGEDYVAWQPFDQVPAWRDGEVQMFETGAILLRLAEAHPTLLPAKPQARWQAISWLFAALNSIEPGLMQLVTVILFHQDKSWSGEAAAALRPFAEKRLQRLADALGDKDWLAGTFSIADIAMVTVLANADDALIEAQPHLAAYCARGHARPAYKRAMAAQLADFVEDNPKEEEGA
ncbi:MAG: glutathione S-transferase family protein [Erythrobacter sp.]|nr:MAG: glutathione S-transferase family protein [Erythrobacter sp.]